MGGGKNIKQKKDERNREVFSKVERIYGGRKYVGEERKLKKCERTNRGI